MRRKAGHLALGIGKAAGATVTLIPEEFPEGGVRLKALVDTLVGSIIKRVSYGRRDGVAILAEGLVLDIPPEDLAQLEDVERDAHGNVRIAEVNIGEILKAQVQARLKQFGIKTTIVAKNIGYELRCADPIPFDMEYTRDLGYCATKYLLSGSNAAMVSLQGGHFVPIPFQELLDPKTGKAKIRLVDTRSTRYAIARRYMIRLRRDDFQDGAEGRAVAVDEKPLVDGMALELAEKSTEVKAGWMPARQRLALGIPLHPDRMSRDDWQTLPGIGERLAAQIELGRQKYGDFGSFAALDRVKGIGPAKLKVLRPFFVSDTNDCK